MTNLAVLEKRSCLSAFEAARFATLAETARANSDGGEDALADAWDNLKEEARVCYVAADHGDFDLYMGEVYEILVSEWNAYGEEAA